jgi:hypothetical protein
VNAQLSTEFRFTGFDGGSRLTAILAAVGSPFILIPLGLGYPLWIYVVVGLLTFSLGMRFSITVTPRMIRVTKKWLFIPYWSARSSQIHDVWYSGDWGLPDGALGVVLDLDRTQVHIGSSRTMRLLFDALRPISVEGRRYSDAKPDDLREPTRDVATDRASG